MATFEEMLAGANEKNATIMESKGYKKEAENMKRTATELLRDVDSRRQKLCPADRQQIDTLDAQESEYRRLLAGNLSPDIRERFYHKVTEITEKINGILSKYD